METQPMGGADTPAVRPGWLALVGVLLGALVVLFPGVFALSHTFFYRDYALFGYPLAEFHRASFWQGELPLWNPYSDCGLPFLAQWNTLTLYPPALIYLLLPMPWALGFFNLLHLVLGGVGMHLLARDWTRDPAAAGVAGTVFALSGLSLHALMWPNVIAALAWMPWVVRAVDAAAQTGGRRVVIAALLGGLQLLAGAPEIIGLTWLAVGGLWLAQIGKLPAAGILRMIARVAIVGVLAAGLAAAQLLPFMDLLAQSQRDTQYDTNVWAMPLWGWASLLVPLFHTTPSLTGVHSQLTQQWTSSYYTGIATLALAALALGRKGERRVLALAVLAVVGLWLSLGAQGGLHAALKAVFPPLGLVRYPIKFVVLTLFALPLLAAYGLAAWNHREVGGQRLAVIVGGLGLAIALLILQAWRQPVAWEDWRVTAGNGLIRLLFLAGFAGLLWWQARGSLPARWAAWLPVGLMCLVALDAITHAPRQNPLVPVEAYARAEGQFPGRTTLGEGRACLDPATHLKMGYAVNPNALEYCRGNRLVLYANWNLVDRIPKVDGFYSLYLREQQQVQRLVYASTNTPPAPLLDFLGVRQITSDTEWLAWRARSNALPLLTIGQRPRFGEEQTVLRALATHDFAPRQEVWLSGREAALRAEADPAATIQLTRLAAHEVTAFATAERPTVVVIAQTWHPNWRAWVDGAPVPVLRANHAFQAVAVPPGRHQLRLAYVDRHFQVGLAISLLTLAGCAVAWLCMRRKILPA